MAVPGTGSTNQSLTFAASKKLAGKAHTSNLKEIYNETIPSNVQLSTELIFGQPIPQTVSTTTLYSTFSASANDPVTVEYVEFHIESISGTTYDANTGSFGDVGFGGGDEAQSSGPHGYQLKLTSSYQSLSSGSWAGTGNYVNNKIIHETNGALQLVNPSFGPQAGNNYGLQIYTGHPSHGGLQIPTTSPIEWSIDYFNGVIFVQDFKSTAVPTYARGFIYVGKTAKTLITEASSSGGDGGGGSGVITALNNKAENRLVSIGSTTTQLDGEANLTFDGSRLSLQGGLILKRRQISTHITASSTDYYIGISASSNLDIRLPGSETLTSGQTFVFKDEIGTAGTHTVRIITSGSQTIDGAANISLESPFAAINLYSDGTSKYFIF